jgi:SLOG-like protein
VDGAALSGAPPIHAKSPKDLGRIAKGSAILLSASLPVKKDYEGNARHLETARPERIRAAVVELAKWAFTHDLSLVFGGHPAISPLVLEVARRFLQNAHEPRVFVFQSQHFAEDARPRATHDLVSWDAGRLVLTPPVEDSSGPDRESSLEVMRRIMVRWPGLIGAVFIGGMDGIQKEADLFKGAGASADADPNAARSARPCFAVASGGGAAADLLEAGDRYAGLGRHVPAKVMADVLRHGESYPLVMQLIFRELGIPSGGSHG